LSPPAKGPWRQGQLFGNYAILRLRAVKMAGAQAAQAAISQSSPPPTNFWGCCRRRPPTWGAQRLAAAGCVSVQRTTITEWMTTRNQLKALRDINISTRSRNEEHQSLLPSRDKSSNNGSLVSSWSNKDDDVVDLDLSPETLSHSEHSG